MTTAGKELFAALALAQGMVRGVGNDATNQHARYRYTSAEALIKAARAWLAPCGLALIESAVKLVEHDPRTRGKGDTQVVGRLEVTYLLTHSSGEHMELASSVPVLVGNGRPDDKGEAAARTYALGYQLRGLLLIDRPEEEDAVDQRNDEPQERQEREQAPNVDLRGVRDELMACDSIAALELWGSRHGSTLAALRGPNLERMNGYVSDQRRKLESS